MQTFLASDVVKIEFVHGFTKESWGNVNRSSSIYVVLKNTDKIEVLMRYAIRPVSIPIKHNQPPIDEANIISGFLKVPLETVDIVSLDNGIKNFGKAISPPQYDRTRVILQAPTQEELDKKE